MLGQLVESMLFMQEILGLRMCVLTLLGVGCVAKGGYRFTFKNGVSGMFEIHVTSGHLYEFGR